MYKRNDLLYLPETRKHFENSSDLYSYLSDKFHMDIVDSDAALRTSILCLCYICQYITREEMSFYLGSYFSSSAIRRMLLRLCEEKLLCKDHFAEKDSYSVYAYCLSKKAIDHAASYFPLETRQALKRRKSNGLVPEHDYSAGINMLHFLASPLSFLWKKEYTFGGLYKVRRSLCVDYLVSVSGSRQIYLEQDMGTETLGRVIEKLSLYSEHGLTSDEENCLIFSMRIVPPSAKNNSIYSASYARAILKEMQEKHIKSLFTYYEQFDGDKAAVAKLKQFLCVTGVCEAETEDADERIRRIGKHDFTCADMECYCNDLRDMVNPYFAVLQNRQQALSAFRKEMSMADILIRYMEKGHCDREPVRVLLGGFDCYVLPTALLGNYFKVIMPEKYAQLPKYRASLEKYYSTGEYLSKGPVISTDNLPNLYLRHVFELTTGGYVCITSVFSLTGIIQAYFLNQIDLPFPVHFIFICDTEKQAHQIAEITGCLTDNSYIEPESASFCAYFLLTADVGKTDSLKGVCKYEYASGAEYEFFSAKPISEKIDTRGIVSLDALAATLFGDDE